MYAKRIIGIIIFILAMILLGTLGFMLIEGWNFLDSIYMTIIILTTIGFQEVHPLSGSGKVFTMIFSLIGFSILAGSISILSSAIIEGKVINIYRRKRMQKRISKLKKHTIICGAGHIGKHVIREIINLKEEFVVIDYAGELLQQIQSELEANSKSNEFLYLEGDAGREEVLLQAGIEQAAGLISCLPQDAQNLLICLTAKTMNPKLKIASFVIEEQNSSKFFRIGVDEVISGNFLIGKRLALSVKNSNIISFLDQVTYINKEPFYLEEVQLMASSPLVGKMLKETGIAKEIGLLIIAVKKQHRQKYDFNPKADTSLDAGDILITIGPEGDLEKLKKYVNG